MLPLKNTVLRQRTVTPRSRGSFPSRITLDKVMSVHCRTGLCRIMQRKLHPMSALRRCWFLRSNVCPRPPNTGLVPFSSAQTHLNIRTLKFLSTCLQTCDNSNPQICDLRTTAGVSSFRTAFEVAIQFRSSEQWRKTTRRGQAPRRPRRAPLIPVPLPRSSPLSTGCRRQRCVGHGLCSTISQSRYRGAEVR